MRMSVGRLVSVLLALLLVTSVADARTSARKCRKACKPLVTSVCPPKGRALRKCRKPILGECRRDGVAVCALGMPTDGAGDGGTTTTTPTTLAPPLETTSTLAPLATTTTAPASPTTSTTVAPPLVTTTTTAPRVTTTTTAPRVTTTTTAPPVTTTTTAPPVTTTTTLPPLPVPDVSGTWTFEGAIVEHACGFNESYEAIESTLVVLQNGNTLSGSATAQPIEGDDVPASGQVTGGGWTFATAPDCRVVPDSDETCCLTFSVDVGEFGSPAAATGTAIAACDQGSSCQAAWVGSVTRVE